MEDWRQIPTFPLYEICVDGRVRNRETGKYLKIQWINGAGTVFLFYKGKSYGRSVSLLIKKIFGVKSVSHSVSGKVPCKICGGMFGSNIIRQHEKNCQPKEADVEYFEH